MFSEASIRPANIFRSYPMKSVTSTLLHIHFFSDVFDAFKSFHAFVTTQKGTKLKNLRTYNGGEFTSSEFKTILLSFTWY